MHDTKMEVDIVKHNDQTSNLPQHFLSRIRSNTQPSLHLHRPIPSTS